MAGPDLTHLYGGPMIVSAGSSLARACAISVVQRRIQLKSCATMKAM
jgi:hypothetical protein